MVSNRTYTIQLDETAIAAFTAAADHTKHLDQNGEAERATCEAIWDFGEHLTKAIITDPSTSPEQVLRLSIGFGEDYPSVELPADVVKSYLHALETLNTIEASISFNPYQDALDVFRRMDDIQPNIPAE